jgi:hypothetical protein
MKASAILTVEIASLLCLLSTLAIAGQGVKFFFTCAQLYELCNNNDLHCSGYLAGATDLEAIDDHKILCLPEKMIVKQVALTFIKFVQDHPESMTDSAAAVVAQSLLQAYPCKVPNPPISSDSQ